MKSIRFKITVIIFLIIVLFSIGLMIIVRNIVIDKLSDDISETIYVQQEKIDEGFTQILDTVNLIYSPIVLSDVIYDIDSDDLSLEEKELLFQSLLAKTPIDNQIFGDIILIYNNDYIHRYNQNSDEYVNFNDLNFVKEVLDNNAFFYQGGMITGNDDNKYLIFGKPFSKYYYPENNGCLIFSVKYEAFNRYLLNDEASSQYSFVVQDKKKVLFHTDKDLVGSVIFESELFSFGSDKNYDVQEINGNRSLVVLSKCQKISNQYHFDWHIISVTSYDTLFAELNRLNTYIYILTFVSTLVALILGFFITRGLVKPVANLSDSMKEYSKTGQPIKLKTKSGDEIEELEKSFDDMVSTISKLIETNNFEQEEKRKLELDALQLQINPHFLYNTLDAISWLARLNNQKEIEQLVLSLAQFFRISLHKGDKYITVEEEIDIIRNFIAIELIRFPDKFTIEYLIDEDVKNEETMKLILQPIVENAIKHGISALDRVGHIIIKAYADKKYIYFEVIDDGIGFEMVENRLPRKEKTSGYGLKNVNERIRLEYGEDSGLSIFSHLNEGTRVIVKIVKRPLS